MAATEAAPLAAVTASDPMRPEPFEVRHVTKETGDTFTLTLAPVAGARFRPFAPGQFNMLYVFGVGEVADLDQRRPGAAGAARPHDPRGGRRHARDAGAAEGRLGRRARARSARAWPVDQAARPRRRADRGRHRPRAAPAGALPRAAAPRRSTGAWCCSTARARPRDMLFPKELRELALAASTSWWT